MVRSIINILKQKDGAVAVLLMCIMGSLILIISVLVAASVAASGKSYADATLQLSGKSILSEYDKKLLSEYGLLCFRGDERDIEDKLLFYANGSFNDDRFEYSYLSSNKDKIKLLKLNMESADVTLKEYSMVNVDLYEDQIKDAMKMNFLTKVKRSEHDSEEGRTLKNEIVIDSLPSAGYKGRIFPNLEDITNIPAWEDIKNSTTGKMASVAYIMKVFKYANQGDLPKETFFNNEVEYILEGKFSDKANYDSVKLKLSAIRLTLNTIHITKSKSKMAAVEVLSAAAAFAEVPPAAAKALIIGTWAAAEAKNDIDLLEDGENVAMIKTNKNWALNDPAKIIDGVTLEKGIKPKNTSGQSYEDYLKVLLSIEDRETMLLRMMDLTQINMKGTYYEDFLLKEHFAGFRFNTTIKGDNFNYVQQY